MIALVKKITVFLVTPVAWTILTIILLCLPGSSFPGDGVFIKIPHVDKVVHVILFGGMVVLWGLYFSLKKPEISNLRMTIILTVVLTIILGICLEYIQLRYVPNRAFDKGDIVANTVSAILFGTLFFFRRQHP
jgi:FtsH-binding integral membrane protein